MIFDLRTSPAFQDGDPQVVASVEKLEAKLAESREGNMLPEERYQRELQKRMEE